MEGNDPSEESGINLLVGPARKIRPALEQSTLERPNTLCFAFLQESLLGPRHILAVTFLSENLALRKRQSENMNPPSPFLEPPSPVHPMGAQTSHLSCRLQERTSAAPHRACRAFACKLPDSARTSVPLTGEPTSNSGHICKNIVLGSIYSQTRRSVAPFGHKYSSLLTKLLATCS